MLLLNVYTYLVVYIFFAVSERGAHWGVNSVAECSTNFFLVKFIYLRNRICIPQKNMIDIANVPVSLLFSFIFSFFC